MLEVEKRGAARSATFAAPHPLSCSLTWPEQTRPTITATTTTHKRTQDLAICVHGTTKVAPDTYLNTEAFMDAVSAQFQQKRQAKAKM
jgi:isocitrate dehydrogenase